MERGVNVDGLDPGTATDETSGRYHDSGLARSKFSLATPGRLSTGPAERRGRPPNWFPTPVANRLAFVLSRDGRIVPLTTWKSANQGAADGMEQDNKRQLVEDGFCVVSELVPDGLLDRLREATDRLVAEQSAEQAAMQRNTGSMIPAVRDPILAELITLPAALDAFREMGYGRPSFSDGWIISKPPHSPRLFWHYDWFAWHDPVSYRADPAQVALMYYLHDTRRKNGCLRVIPGSHNHHNPMHEVLDTPRHELTGTTATDRAEFEDRPDEIDLPMRAGDVLIADARLLHAGHENQTDEHRTLITLWYQPDLVALPEPIQAQMAAKAQMPGPAWPAEAVELLDTVRTRYDGGAQPCERTMYRPAERSLPVNLRA